MKGAFTEPWFLLADSPSVFNVVKVHGKKWNQISHSDEHEVANDSAGVVSADTEIHKSKTKLHERRCLFDIKPPENTPSNTAWRVSVMRLIKSHHILGFV